MNVLQVGCRGEGGSPAPLCTPTRITQKHLCHAGQAPRQPLSSLPGHLPPRLYASAQVGATCICCPRSSCGKRCVLTSWGFPTLDECSSGSPSHWAWSAWGRAHSPPMEGRKSLIPFHSGSDSSLHSPSINLHCMDRLVAECGRAGPPPLRNPCTFPFRMHGIHRKIPTEHPVM